MRRFGFAQNLSSSPPVPTFLSSLLHRTRAGILVMLLAVLPLQGVVQLVAGIQEHRHCLLYTSPSPRDRQKSRMPSSA